ncbi:hypothetical protein ACWEJP_26195 [Streptomyces sp. NPDC004749]
MHQKQGSGTRRAVPDTEAERSTGDERDEAGERGAGAPTERRRLDLNLPQVAGSALAAIAAAVLASRLGVYGTVLGAGVVSVVATCGGSVFQHLFRRTGEQIRVVTVQAKPGGRQVVVRSDRNGGGGATSVADPGGSDNPRVPGESPDPGDPYVPVDATRLLRVPRDLNTEYGEATTHGARARARARTRRRERGWKRPLLAAVGVFVLAMAGVTGFELMSGQGLGGGHATTVGSVVRGGGGGSVPEDSPAPDPSSGSSSGGQGQGQDGGASPDPNASPDTGQGAGGDGGGGAGPSRTPATPPSGGGDGARSGDPTPAPSGTSGGGSGTDKSGPSGPDSSGTGATPDSGSGSGSGTGSGADSGSGTGNR